MTRFLYAFALPLLLAAGPATAQTRSGRLVADVAYEAKGSGPAWQLAVGDRIALRLGADADGFVVMQYFPRARPRRTDAVRRWESRTPGGATIVIEAREEACRLGADRYRDTVTVTAGERRLNGCGGRRDR
ncbi:hypothetical protein [Allosphingosinicella sp.]|uniref:hypothetical protein n=1 Tax=Allosphingosinicella sp. TaxID=2823234 RepID=UPI003782E7AD